MSEGVPALSRWQQALIEKLNRDAAGEADAALVGVLQQVLVNSTEPVADGALGVLQSRLYRASESKTALDESVQWVGVRDFLQEAEVAAGMVQSHAEC